MNLFLRQGGVAAPPRFREDELSRRISGQSGSFALPSRDEGRMAGTAAAAEIAILVRLRNRRRLIN
jgi:hypothetical protein